MFANMSYAIENIIPISMFNKGQAGKIFSEVKAGKSKIVIKNNEPEAIIMSPQEYIALQERLEDLELMQIVTERRSCDTGLTYSDEAVRREYGITEKDLELLIGEADSDGDGLISYDEFINFMEN